MTTVNVPGIQPTPGPDTLYGIASTTIREPSGVAWDGTTAVYTWTPDLTAAQLTAFTDLVATFRTRDVNLTPEEYAAIKPFLATGRLFVQQSQSQYTGLTQAQINRMNFDNITALWRVIFRLLRDS